MEQESYIVVAILLAVGLFTLFSMTKIWGEAFWKESPAQGEGSPLHPRHLSSGALFLLVAPAVLLAGLTVLIGLAAEPLFDLSMQAALQLLNPDGYMEAVLGRTP